MTTQEKESLISKMVDHPDWLTERELDAILLDEELREVYHTSLLLASTLAPIPEPDADKAWQELKSRLHRKSRGIRIWWFSAAAAVAIALFVWQAVRMNVTLPAESPMPEIIAVAAPQQPQQPVETRKHIAAETKPVTTVRHKRTKNISKQADEAAEAEEFLRIEQARIDQEIALQLQQMQERVTLALNEYVTEDALIMPPPPSVVISEQNEISIQTLYY